MRLLALCGAVFIAATVGASAQSPVERGGYLVNGIGGCSNCHTPRGPGGATDLQLDKRLSGSTQTFQAPQYTVKGSNLTPDAETGLGSWSKEQIITALQKGVRPDGKRAILGVSVSLSEAEVHWRDFLASLQERGLHGVRWRGPRARARGERN